MGVTAGPALAEIYPDFALIGKIVGKRLQHYNRFFLHGSHLSVCHKETAKDKKYPSRRLWVPWAGSLWHKRAGLESIWKYFITMNLSTNESTVMSELDQWEPGYISPGRRRRKDGRGWCGCWRCLPCLGRSSATPAHSVDTGLTMEINICARKYFGVKYFFFTWKKEFFW